MKPSIVSLTRQDKISCKVANKTFKNMAMFGNDSNKSKS